MERIKNFTLDYANIYFGRLCFVIFILSTFTSTCKLDPNAALSLLGYFFVRKDSRSFFNFDHTQMYNFSMLCILSLGVDVIWFAMFAHAPHQYHMSIISHFEGTIKFVYVISVFVFILKVPFVLSSWFLYEQSFDVHYENEVEHGPMPSPTNTRMQWSSLHEQSSIPELPAVNENNNLSAQNNNIVGLNVEPPPNNKKSEEEEKEQHIQKIENTINHQTVHNNNIQVEQREEKYFSTGANQINQNGIDIFRPQICQVVTDETETQFNMNRNKNNIIIDTDGDDFKPQSQPSPVTVPSPTSMNFKPLNLNHKIATTNTNSASSNQKDELVTEFLNDNGFTDEMTHY